MVQQAHRLHKSRDDRFMFGVAGGIAEYFDVDPVLVRGGWVLLTVATGGIGLLVYIVLAIVTPKSRRQVSRTETISDDSSELPESAVDVEEDERPLRRHTARNVLAVGLIVVGMIVLLSNLGVFGSIRWEIVWPVAIVVLGLTILVPSIRRERS
jgi:phage shock protein C